MKLNETKSNENTYLLFLCTFGEALSGVVHPFGVVHPKGDVSL